MIDILNISSKIAHWWIQLKFIASGQQSAEPILTCHHRWAVIFTWEQLCDIMHIYICCTCIFQCLKPTACQLLGQVLSVPFDSGKVMAIVTDLRNVIANSSPIYTREPHLGVYKNIKLISHQHAFRAIIMPILIITRRLLSLLLRYLTSF